MLRALQYTTLNEPDDLFARPAMIALDFVLRRLTNVAVPANVGELEERLGVGFEVELLGHKHVGHGHVLDRVDAERAKDAAPHIDFLDVPGATAREAKPALADVHVEVPSTIQLPELPLGEDRSEKSLGTRVGRLQVLFALLGPRGVPAVGPVHPLLIRTGAAKRVEPLVGAVPAPAALVFVEVLMGHRVFERDPHLLLELTG